MAFSNDIIGKFGVSKKPIIFYETPGGKAYKTRELSKYGYATTSKISGLNSAKTWAKFNDVTSGKDMWIPYNTNSDMKFYLNFNQQLGKEVPPSTPEEIEAAKRMGITLAAGAAVPGGSEIVGAGYAVKESVSDAIDSIGNSFGQIFGYLKWLVIIVAIIVILYLAVKLKEA